MLPLICLAILALIANGSLLSAGNDLLNGQWLGLMPHGVGLIGQHLFVLRLLDRVGVIETSTGSTSKIRTGGSHTFRRRDCPAEAPRGARRMPDYGENRAAHQELAKEGLMVPGHSFSGGRERFYRLTVITTWEPVTSPSPTRSSRDTP